MAVKFQKCDLTILMHIPNYPLSLNYYLPRCDLQNHNTMTCECDRITFIHLNRPPLVTIPLESQVTTSFAASFVVGGGVIVGFQYIAILIDTDDAPHIVSAPPPPSNLAVTIPIILDIRRHPDSSSTQQVVVFRGPFPFQSHPKSRPHSPVTLHHMYPSTLCRLVCRSLGICKHAFSSLTHIYKIIAPVAPPAYRTNRKWVVGEWCW